jgi:hydrogenase-4 membrane subunit HyfE
VALLIGVFGIVGFVVFQALLITGVMSFSEQIGYVSASALIFGVWIVITGFLGRRSGRLHNSVAVIILGALYIGYPLWAYRVGQQLLSGNRTTIK